MAPPTEPLNLDVEAISGICGSISIACWVVVFSPQIIENFRRRSADAISIQFVVVWLLGDVFNILGAVLQGVLPTMIILAIYYTIADIVLMAQCFYYRGFTLRDDVPAREPAAATSQRPKSKRKRNGDASRSSSSSSGNPREPDERTGLLPHGSTPRRSRAEQQNHQQQQPSPYPYAGVDDAHERRGSWTHLSPAVPFVSDESDDLTTIAAGTGTTALRAPTTWLQACALNSLAILMVCAAGVAGWWLSRTYGGGQKPKKDPSAGDGGAALEFNTLGQVFGWLCAVLYLGSRLPQLLLNWRRKSTEGVSILFFLFACLGNLTYVLSILAFDPECEGKSNGNGGGADEGGKCAPGEAAQLFWQYILVNLSWLAGSAGTLLLDMGIFVQFFMYNKSEADECCDSESTDDEESSIDGETAWDRRPILERNNTGY